MMVGLVFFFSSRRRHTRYWRDWSSDVCSSDLVVSVCAERAAGPVDSLTGLVATRDVAADAAVGVQDRGVVATAEVTTDRSEERRVGEECRSRWAPCHLKKKKYYM